ncbi:MAG: hypothetical protein R6V44_04670 [Paracoccaceae bacterium]
MAASVCADLIPVEGNPLETLSLVAGPGTASVMIMQDGVIRKHAPE